VPVDAIAEDLLGLEVERAAIDCSGMLFPADRRILVNAAEPETRQRFTIAHELGHWVCQRLEGHSAPVYCRADEIGLDPEVKALEREANLFAAELLMPEGAVRAAFARDEGAESLGVSENALAWRFYNFALVAEKPAP
jgi:Zn-dependent peptidase ImmA (M78 family)